MKDLDKSRTKTRHTSKKYYRKRSSLVRTQRRARYTLAEPRGDITVTLEVHFQREFLEDPDILEAIIFGFEKEHKVTNQVRTSAYENAVCKKAASHLVRTSLQARRHAVYTILDTKKKVINKDLRGRQDFGHTRHYSCWEPFYYEAGYTWDYLSGDSPYKLPPIAVKEDGSCSASDIEWVRW